MAERSMGPERADRGGALECMERALALHLRGPTQTKGDGAREPLPVLAVPLSARPSSGRQQQLLSVGPSRSFGAVSVPEHSPFS